MCENNRIKLHLPATKGCVFALCIATPWKYSILYVSALEIRRQTKQCPGINLHFQKTRFTYIFESPPPPKHTIWEDYQILVLFAIWYWNVRHSIARYTSLVTRQISFQYGIQFQNHRKFIIFTCWSCWELLCWSVQIWMYIALKFHDISLLRELKCILSIH
jgi:hypothetical protein